MFGFLDAPWVRPVLGGVALLAFIVKSVAPPGAVHDIASKVMEAILPLAAASVGSPKEKPADVLREAAK